MTLINLLKRSESWVRSGSGNWNVSNEVAHFVFDSLTKENNLKSKVAIRGIANETKVDMSIYEMSLHLPFYMLTVPDIQMDIEAKHLRNAPPSAPSAPKNKWRRKP